MKSSLTTIILSIRKDSLFKNAVKNEICVRFSWLTIKEVNVRADIEQLKKEELNFSIFINFDNGVIVPEEVLENLDWRAFNYHSAPPEYPGRDVHHFAIYDDAEYFGATLHKMTKRVDEGQILSVRRFKISVTDTPISLAIKGLESAFEIFCSTIDKLIFEINLTPITNEVWSGRAKGTRDKMLSMGELTPDMDIKEVQRRIRAFHHLEHRNIFIQIHGFKFFLN